MTEDELEQLALGWFQDAGWEYRHGPDLAPEGETPAATVAGFDVDVDLVDKHSGDLVRQRRQPRQPTTPARGAGC